MNKNSLKPLLPMILLFVLLSVFFIAGKSLLLKWGMDQDVLLLGNLLLFVVSLTSYLVTYKGLNSSNPQAFVRAMYGSFMIKFFVIAIAAFIYIRITGKDVNKSALFTCMGLYLIYTFIEVSVLTKLLKEKKNA
jgi:ACR3 family arsenite efflux pump ArsB